MDLQTLQQAVAGQAAAFRCITRYQPAGGPGDKVFPPTYDRGQYATEQRVNPATGELRNCVLLDSVASQANRMELALLSVYRAGAIRLPIIEVRFDQDDLLHKFTVTSLEASHRVADALFRDSRLDGKIFRSSAPGKLLDHASVTNATGIFGICPTALVFGFWDSTGPRGGGGAKFQRTITSEIIGYDAVPGKKTSSHIDPAGIRLGAGTLYKRATESDEHPNWTIHQEQAASNGNRPQTFRDGRPSSSNLGNVTPSVDDKAGGFTISEAVQTTTLSLAAIRRLRFPLNGAADSNAAVDLAARTTLAALGLAAGTLARADTDLRSRCHLIPQNPVIWELLDQPGRPPAEFPMNETTAIALLDEAIISAQNAGLPWENIIQLTPSPELLELVKRSQELDAQSAEQN